MNQFRLILVPDQKFIFIPIEKCANTYMKSFIYSNWECDELKERFQLNNHLNNKIRKEAFGNTISIKKKLYPIKKIQLIHKNEAFFLEKLKNNFEICIFVRNPIKRYLSSFCDKRHRIIIKKEERRLALKQQFDLLLDRLPNVDRHFRLQNKFIPKSLLLKSSNKINIFNIDSVEFLKFKKYFNNKFKNITFPDQDKQNVSTKDYTINDLTSDQLRKIKSVYKEDFEILHNFL